MLILNTAIPGPAESEIDIEKAWSKLMVSSGATLDLIQHHQ